MHVRHHAYTRKKRIERIQQHVFYYFFIVSQLYIEHGPHTHACARAYREKKSNKKENTKYFLCYRFDCILSYTHTHTYSKQRKKEFTSEYGSDKDRGVKWKADEKRGTYITDRIRISRRRRRRIHVACRPNTTRPLPSISIPTHTCTTFLYHTRYSFVHAIED